MTVKDPDSRRPWSVVLRAAAAAVVAALKWVAQVPGQWWRVFMDKPTTALVQLFIFSFALAAFLRYTRPVSVLVVLPFELADDAPDELAVTGRSVARIVLDEVRLVTQLADSSSRDIIGELDPTRTGIEVEGFSVARVLQEWRRLRQRQDVITGDVLFDEHGLTLRARAATRRDSVSVWDAGPYPVTVEGVEEAAQVLALHLAGDSLAGLYYLGIGEVDSAIDRLTKWTEQPTTNDGARVALGNALQQRNANEPLPTVFEEQQILGSPESRQVTQDLTSVLSEEEAQRKTSSALLYASAYENLRWGIPGGECDLLVRDHYIACYSDTLRIPVWVGYHIDPSHLMATKGSRERNDFRSDDDLPEGSRAELEDYRRSGWDRGHLAPSGAFVYSRTAMSETNLLSNIAPQHPEVNRGAWSQLEESVQEHVRAMGEVWVVSGTLMLTETGTPDSVIGANRVAVPTHFYKAVISEDGEGERRAFAFLVPNAPAEFEDLDQFRVSIDSLEMLSGLDFFPELDDSTDAEASMVFSWPRVGRSGPS
jgi:endonuclease G